MGSFYRYVVVALVFEEKQLVFFLLWAGGDHIVTPRQFLRDLEMKLRQEDEQ